MKRAEGVPMPRNFASINGINSSVSALPYGPLFAVGVGEGVMAEAAARIEHDVKHLRHTGDIGGVAALGMPNAPVVAYRRSRGFRK